jgi:hypothetical protein
MNRQLYSMGMCVIWERILYNKSSRTKLILIRIGQLYEAESKYLKKKNIYIYIIALCVLFHVISCIQNLDP